jgi:hypothetical protein
MLASGRKPNCCFLTKNNIFEVFLHSRWCWWWGWCDSDGGYHVCVCLNLFWLWKECQFVFQWEI